MGYVVCLFVCLFVVSSVKMLTRRAFASDRESALRCVRGSKDLECLALGVQIYLAMNRPDLAEKELKTMQSIDDDHSCTQLATAWLFVAAGGEKYQDACIIFQELAEKFSPSAFLLNSQAVW